MQTSTPSNLQQNSKSGITNDQVAPPPWRLKGVAYWMILSLIGKPEETLIRQSRDSKSEPNDQPELGPAYFDILEASSRQHATVPGLFLGGLSTVQIIRYFSSPVGPYDELMVTTGKFVLPDELNQVPMPRITRIYVSTLQAVFNGRNNWNIPKHLARFEFTPSSSGAVMVSVYALESYTFTQFNKAQDSCFNPVFAPAPFFCTTITPLGPKGLRLPIRLSTLPGAPTSIVQPPLEEGDPALGLAGSKLWKQVNFDIAGRVALCRAVGGLQAPNGGKRFADGIKFPDFKPYQICMHWTDLVIDFFQGVTLFPKSQMYN